MAEQNRFYFYYSWFGYFALLSDEDCKRFILAIKDFVVNDRETELDENLQNLFDLVTDQIKSDKAAYSQKCEKNRQNGEKGGRPPKEHKKEYSQSDEEFLNEWNKI